MEEENKYSLLIKQCTDIISKTGGTIRNSILDLNEMPGFTTICIVSEFDNTKTITVFRNVYKDTEMSIVFSITEPTLIKMKGLLAA